ncbi:MAG: M23 family metallopeptidase [Bacteroidetes bacterium]|nr:M23 family metallopeptidase [Bacteroidota bacterium]
MIKLLCSCLLALPLHHVSVTSGFGFRMHPVTGRYTFHAGVDLRAHADTVYAVTSGSVAAGYNPFLGNYVRVVSGDLQIIYGHLSQLFVLTGDSVFCAEPLAISGSTGRVTGEHLHFAVSWRGHDINPLLFLLHALQQMNIKNKENKP